MDDHIENTDQIFMEELKQEFKETITRNLKQFVTLIQENNLEEIARIAHDIKGTAGIFGLDQGSDIAHQIRIAALDGDTAKTKELLDQLEAYMKANQMVIS